MIDYSSLSDFDINKRVAKALGYKIYKDGHSVRKDHVLVEDYGRSGAIAMDWCNNASEACKIIIEHRIGIAPYHPISFAWSTKHGMASEISTEDINTLRAAMIVFLMMKENG